MPGDQPAGGIRIFPAQTNGHPHDRALIAQEFLPDAFPFLFDRLHVGAGRFEGVLAPGFFPRGIEVELRASKFQPAVLFFRGFGGVARLAFDIRERPENGVERPENGVGLWGLGSRWSAERDQVADFSAAKKLPSVIRC